MIAKEKPSQMAPEIKATALQLMTEKDLAGMETGGMDFLQDQARDRLFGSIPGPVRAIMEAENKLRSMMSVANTPFEQLEQVAVLTGDYQPRKGDREIPKGRWSFHPTGYFVRYMPHGYSHTTIDVYMPEVFTVQRDANGMIKSIADPGGNRLEFAYGSAAGGRAPLQSVTSFRGDSQVEKFESGLADVDASRLGDQVSGALQRGRKAAGLKGKGDEAKDTVDLGALRLALLAGKSDNPGLADAAEMVTDAWMSAFAAQCKSAILLASTGSAMASLSFDPSNDVATPGETGRQRLSQSARCRDDGPGSSDTDGLRDMVVSAMNAHGYKAGPDDVMVYDQRGDGGLLRFMVRMGHSNNPLPTRQCIEEGGTAGNEGAKEILLGAVQTSGSTTRVTVRTVDVETGVVTGAGKGDGGSTGDAANQAFGNYKR